MKRITSFVFLLLLLLAAPTVKAQGTELTAPHNIILKDSTLSGIHLYPDLKQKSFMLAFTQTLTEPALLELSDPEGKVIFSKALSPTDKDLHKPMKVGKLKNGIYTVEVKTFDTIYWARLKVTL